MAKNDSAFDRFFFLAVSADETSVRKVGQYPPWDISLDPRLEAMLADHADSYKKGVICESQGYGIGAFSYYRRIVEEIIDQLLADIGDLIPGEEEEGRKVYENALARVRETPVAQDKIELVKDLLPAILRPGGINPLAVLHDVLSEGLHGKSDEECLEYAMAVRTALVFLVNQVADRKAAAATFTESMRKLLDRRAGTASKKE